MLISSSYSNTQKPLGIDPQVASGQANSRAQSVAKQEIKVDSEQTQKNNNANSQQRFDVNEQAIAFFESQQASNQGAISADNQSQFLPSNKSTDFSKNTAQDQASQQNKTAISAYQNVGNIAQRESVQALFGVDLLA